MLPKSAHRAHKTRRTALTTQDEVLQPPLTALAARAAREATTTTRHRGQPSPLSGRNTGIVATVHRVCLAVRVCATSSCPPVFNFVTERA